MLACIPSSPTFTRSSKLSRASPSTATVPVVSIYIDNPNRFAENELRADICVPVMVVGDIERSTETATA